jgi:FkbM family methyltransferase
MSLLTTVRHILNHPLNVKDKRHALARYLRWQLGSRLLPGAVVVPFVNDTHLVVSPGMTGATMYVYTGLADFADCSLLLHLLRPGDLFVDIGANVGVYSVLAAGVIGARAVTVEPVPSTYRKMLENVAANHIEDLVTPHNIGLGSRVETLRFTADRDTMNHVLTDPHWTGPSIEVPVRTLDEVLGGESPRLIKIDVEGWESEVLAGAEAVLSRPALLGLIIEMNSSSAEFSSNEQRVHDCMMRHGFAPYEYAPHARTLHLLATKSRTTPNTIYLRSVDEAQGLLKSADAFRILGREI